MLKLGIGLLTCKAKRVTCDYHNVNVFELRQEPECRLLMNEVETKVQFLKLLKVNITLQKFCMKHNKFISAKVESFQLFDLTHSLKEELWIY